jgi:hypothetical protein
MLFQILITCKIFCFLSVGAWEHFGALKCPNNYVVFDWKVLRAKIACENVASVSLVMGFKVIFSGVRPVADIALEGAIFGVPLYVVKQVASGSNFFGT